MGDEKFAECLSKLCKMIDELKEEERKADEETLVNNSKENIHKCKELIVKYAFDIEKFSNRLDDTQELIAVGETLAELVEELERIVKYVKLFAKLKEEKGV